MSDDLLAKIEEINMEVADDLRDGGMTTKDIQDLCFESLKDIIPAPGFKGAVLRSRVWKVILIIEEVRRIVHKEELYESPEEFLNECVERLSIEVEYTIYFGVYNKSIGHPCKPTPTAKIIHMLQNLHLIFHRQMGKSTKGGKKILDLVYVLKDHEDPEVICSRKQHCHGPMLILDATSAYLICKGSIMCVVQLKKLKEAVLALIGSYYLLDIDYPQSHELGLTMLQQLVFKDRSAPGDLLNAFNATIASYTAFKNSGN